MCAAVSQQGFPGTCGLDKDHFIPQKMCAVFNLAAAEYLLFLKGLFLQYAHH
jgi:hypothetical protein